MLVQMAGPAETGQTMPPVRTTLRAVTHPSGREPAQRSELSTSGCFCSLDLRAALYDGSLARHKPASAALLTRVCPRFPTRLQTKHLNRSQMEYGWRRV